MKIEWNLWMDDTRGCQIVSRDGAINVEYNREQSLTADENAAIHYVVELARQLLRGQPISHFQNPFLVIQEQVQKLVKCKWQRSGKLVMLGQLNPGDKRWKNANTVEEALAKKRVFTCTMAVYDSCPKRRAPSK